MTETNEPESEDEHTVEAVEGEGTTRCERQLSRRGYLAVAGVTATAGVLAGCSEWIGDETTPTETPTTTDRPGYHTYSKSQLKEKYSGLTFFSSQPPNGETRNRNQYTSFTTDIDATYIRSHYASPKLTESEHTISLAGLVEKPVEISMKALKSEFSTVEVAHTMQCAGNGRGYFEPSVAGNQWTFGALGTAVYTGAPVGEVLDQNGAEMRDGLYLAVMGGDAPDGKDVFARSIPMSKIKADCILAYERNGEPLTAEHGFPVRLVVPGWYGCNSVKWVDRMRVMETMLHDGAKELDGDPSRYTHWQQSSYRVLSASDNEPRQHETIETFDTGAQMEAEGIKQPYMYEMLVKSLITSPADKATVTPTDGSVEIRGVAWAGENELERIELSTDGGETFTDAEFTGSEHGPTAWQQFRFDWNVTPGKYTLVSRATDGQGRTQPATISSPEAGLRRIEDNSYPWNRKGYGSNAYMPEAVTVTVAETG